MKHVQPPIASHCRTLSRTAVVVALAIATASQAAITDISNNPIASSTSAAVKPNIMLLMDASGSMARTHMPDELETTAGPTSIGYKASQCNVLYYNPAQLYTLPKRFDGTFFPTPGFAGAPYAGFGAYYAIADLSTTNLNNRFVAYDNSSLDVVSPFPDTPQRAYYYVYTGAQTPKFDAQPCTQHDGGATVPATGGGNWTKTYPTTAGEKQNFAIWYSFYRTRISLIKSAASLAFSPLNDTKRVGFITVEPKDTPGAAAINPIRYLPVNDFDAAQKNLWFSKLFSQKPKGASPAREGLARVGRYYAGQDTGINSGMAATGPNDPLQYACQQNFTIMTTDGYWNGQSQTPGPNGGGVRLDGDIDPLTGLNLVGQQDGDLSDPYSQPPMWDGTSATTRVVTNKVNAYSDGVCSLAGKYRSTYQMQKEIDLVTKDTTRTSRETIQYTSATRQDWATSVQTTKKVTQTTQNTMQYLLTKHRKTIEQYQIVKSQEQTTQVTEQYQLTTSQRAAQTFQTRRVQKQNYETDEQWTTAKSQYVAATTQYVMQKDQYWLGRVQVIMHQYQTIAYDHSVEHGDAIPGLCVASPPDAGHPLGNYPIECRQTEVFTPQFVDPATCVQDLAGSDPNYVKTTCTPGGASTAYAPVGACAPGVTNSGLPNYIVTTCNLVNVDPPAAFNGSCANGTSQTGAPDYFLYTCTLPAGNNISTPVAPCAVGSSSSGAPDWITTSCSQPVGPNNQPATASLPCVVGSTTDGSFVKTTCAKPLNTAGFVAGCVPVAGNVPPYTKTTCTPSTLADDAIDSASCGPNVSVGPAFITTSCPKTPLGPYPAETPVAACVDGATTGNPNYFETTCTNPPANNQTVFTTAALCGPIGVTPASGSLWVTRDCEKPAGANNQTSFNDPALCIGDLGGGFPYLKVTCTPNPVMPPTVVNPASCPIGDSVAGAPGFVVTHCVKQAAAWPASTCAAPLAPAFPNWIVTVCGDAFDYEAVLSCVPGPVLPYLPYDSITCSKNPTSSFVAVCTESAHPPTGPNFIDVTCSGPVTLSNAPVDPATCTDGTSPGPDVRVTTCTTVPFGAYAIPTPVAAPCAGGMDGSFIVTTCSNPPGPNNQAAAASPPCVVGSTTDGSQVKTTCAKSDTPDYVPTAVCADVIQVGSGPSVTCTTTPTLGVLDSGCIAGHVDGGPFFDTTTNCTTTIVNPMANAASCLAVSGPGPGQVTFCNEVPVDVLVADPTCKPGTDASGLRTACTLQFGNGHSYFVTQTDTTTTTPYSGAVATGPGVVVTDVHATVAVDGVCYAAVQPQFSAGVPPGPQPPVSIAGCGGWPCTVDTIGASISENSLADVAQYYYKTNLRPLAPLIDQGRVVPVNAADPESDNATHQHMTTFVVALGVSGNLNFSPDYRSHATITGDFADIRTTVKRWPQWPDPTPGYYTNSDNYNNKKAIDDYWHTAVNGRGLYFSADNPTSVINGLGDALFGTDGSSGSGAAEAVSTLQPVPGNNFVYSTTYLPGKWSGDVTAWAIDPTSGVVSGLNATTPFWSARSRLEAKVTLPCDDRKIYVIHNGSSLHDFTWNTKKCPGAVGPGVLAPDGLDATEQGYFSPLNVSLLSQFPFMTDGAGATAPQQQEAQLPGMLVNFLRGQRGREGFEVGSLSKLFRKRDAVLGDIIDSQAVYVKAPFADYAENAYGTFKAAQSSRTSMLYVGANDGMLHAFYATENLADPLAGTEAWAVIPSAVLPNMYKLADFAYSRGQHEFLVDGTPVVGDAFIGGSWKTILVGGLNAGGKGYYALDVTNAGALPVPLWEFKQNAGVCPATTAAAVGNTSDCNLGLTFGKPIITKLNGTWVVMFTSGYNNANAAGNGQDGIGFLYVVNAQTGAIIHKIATTGGSGATPSGLAQINNYTDNGQVDNTTLHVYGGDVLGNMWRFDFLPGPSATLLGTARDTLTAIEPITVRPELAELDGKPFVMFGTGRLLGASDVTDVQKQSVYGFRDPLIGASPIYANPMRNSLRPMAISAAAAVAGAVRTSTCVGTGAQCALPDGWVLDLNEPGERVNVEMHLVLGALVFTSNVPKLIPCDVGGHSWFTQVDFRTGGPVSNNPGVLTSQYLSDAINVGFNTLQLLPPAGSFNPHRIGRECDSRGRCMPLDINPPEPPPQGKRITWREVTQ